MEKKLEKLETKTFYKLMQAYRHMPFEKQDLVTGAYEQVKKFIRRNFERKTKRPSPKKEQFNENRLMALGNDEMERQEREEPKNDHNVWDNNDSVENWIK